jgi:hypothetical protein
MAWASIKEGNRVGVGPVTEHVVQSNNPHGMPLHFLNIFILHLSAYEDETDSVPKRRHMKFRRRGITQKKTYNIQSTTKI